MKADLSYTDDSSVKIGVTAENSFLPVEFLILQLFISILPKEEGLQCCVHTVPFLHCYL